MVDVNNLDALSVDRISFIKSYVFLNPNMNNGIISALIVCSQDLTIIKKEILKEDYALSFRLVLKYAKIRNLVCQLELVAMPPT